jgi:MFS family permease
VLWNFAVIVSVILTPVFSGYVISDLSWQWSFWLDAIILGVLLAAVILVFSETTYYRANSQGVIRGQTLSSSAADPSAGLEQALGFSDDKSAN